jgi:hypothetical protein
MGQYKQEASMMTKIFLWSLIFFYSSLTYAETCIEVVKARNFSPSAKARLFKIINNLQVAINHDSFKQLVINYKINGVYRYENNNNDTNILINNWTQVYLTEKSQNVDNFVVIYGNSSSQTMISLTKAPTGAVAIGVAALTIGSTNIDRTNVPGNDIDVVIGGINYNFALSPGNNFAFLIREGGYVTRS